MTHTHIACTNERGMRVIQPFNAHHLSFCERSDGSALAVYYVAGEPQQVPVQEKFSDILEMMAACGVAIDCTRERDIWEGIAVEQTENPHYGGVALAPGRFPAVDESSIAPGLVENLKKQLAAKDEENSELRLKGERFDVAERQMKDLIGRLGFQYRTISRSIVQLENEIWSRHTEIHRLNAQIGNLNRRLRKWEDFSAGQQKSLNDQQPAPPAHALSDEAQGLTSDDGVSGD